jgi:hypothetical protein
MGPAEESWTCEVRNHLLRWILMVVDHRLVTDALHELQEDSE